MLNSEQIEQILALEPKNTEENLKHLDLIKEASKHLVRKYLLQNPADYVTKSNENSLENTFVIRTEFRNEAEPFKRLNNVLDSEKNREKPYNSTFWNKEINIVAESNVYHISKVPFITQDGKLLNHLLSITKEIDEKEPNIDVKNLRKSLKSVTRINSITSFGSNAHKKVFYTNNQGEEVILKYRETFPENVKIKYTFNNKKRDLDVTKENYEERMYHYPEAIVKYGLNPMAIIFQKTNDKYYKYYYKQHLKNAPRLAQGIWHSRRDILLEYNKQGIFEGILTEKEIEDMVNTPVPIFSYEIKSVDPKETEITQIGKYVGEKVSIEPKNKELSLASNNLSTISGQPPSVNLNGLPDNNSFSLLTASTHIQSPIFTEVKPQKPSYVDRFFGCFGSLCGGKNDAIEI